MRNVTCVYMSGAFDVYWNTFPHATMRVSHRSRKVPVTIRDVMNRKSESLCLRLAGLTEYTKSQYWRKVGNYGYARYYMEFAKTFREKSSHKIP